MVDNSFKSARTLGVLGDKSIVRREFVGSRDRLDFYKFSLNRSSNVKFQLSGLKENADLTLFNRAGKVMGRSRKGGIQPELLERQLDSGTYYVQVLNRSSKGTRYRLVGSAPLATGGGGSNGGSSGGSSGGTGTRNSPIDLGLLTGTPVSRSRDTAGVLEAGKFYKFRLGAISETTISLSQVTGGGTMRLYYDTNGNGQLDNFDDGPTVKTGSGSTSSNQPISTVLPATGTYFLQVSQDFAPLVYDLTVRTTPYPSNIPTDPGSEPTTAYNLGTLTKGARLEARDYVGNIDMTDLYRFSLSETTNVTFSKQDTAGDINVGLTIYQDKNNNFVLDSGEAIGSLFGTSSSINLPAANNYYISMTQSNVSNTAYTVAIAA